MATKPKAQASGIQCPKCDSTESSVKDSRPGNNTISRRRVCTCGYVFTTYEKAECDIEFIEDDEGDEEIALSA